MQLLLQVQPMDCRPIHGLFHTLVTTDVIASDRDSTRSGSGKKIYCQAIEEFNIPRKGGKIKDSWALITLGVRGPNAASVRSLSQLCFCWLGTFFLLASSAFWEMWWPVIPVQHISQAFHQRRIYALSSISFQIIIEGYPGWPACFRHLSISRQIWYGLGQSHLAQTLPQGTMGCVSSPEEKGIVVIQAASLAGVYYISLWSLLNCCSTLHVSCLLCQTICTALWGLSLGPHTSLLESPWYLTVLCSSIYLHNHLLSTSSLMSPCQMLQVGIC